MSCRVRTIAVLLLLTAAAALAEGDFTFDIRRDDVVTDVGGQPTVSILAGGRALVTLMVEPQGFSGTVSVTKGATDIGTFVVTKDCPPEGNMGCMFETLPIEVAGGPASDSVIVSPSPAAKSGQVVFRANAPGVAEKIVILNVNIREIPPAASVRVEPEELQLLPGQEARVMVSVQGEGEWNGAVDVTAKGSNGTAVSEEQFPLGPLPASKEIVVRALPDAAPNHYAYVKVKVFPQGKTVLLAETNIRSEVAGTAVEYAGAAEPSVVTLKPGETVRVLLSFSPGQSGWNGPLDVTVSKPSGLIVVQESYRVDSLPAQKELYLKLEEGIPLDQQIDMITVSAKPAEGGSDREVALIGVHIDSGTTAGGGGWDESDPMAGLPPAGEPLPRIAEARLAADEVRASSQHLDGLAEAMRRVGQSDEAANQLVAMLDLREALLQEARSLASNALGKEDGADELLAWLVEEVSRPRPEAAYPPYRVAALNVPLLAEIPQPGWEDPSGLRVDPRTGQRVDWTQARSQVEMLVLEMKLAKEALPLAEDWTGPMRARMEKLTDFLEKLEQMGETNLPEKPAGKLSRALRPIMVAGTIITAADVLARACAFALPSRIRRFYAQVGANEVEKWDTSMPVIYRDEAMPIQIYILTTARGGRIVSPSEIVEPVFEAVTGSKKFTEWFDRTFGLDKLAAVFPQQLRDALKEQIRQEAIQRIQAVASRVAGLPAISAWLESGFDVPKNLPWPPLEVNSSRVIRIRSNSSLMRITNDGLPMEQHYYLMGQQVGAPAGYEFGFRRDLQNAVLEADPGPIDVNVSAQVEVSERGEGRPRNECPPQPCPEGLYWSTFVCECRAAIGS